ncbi:MAG: M56 family metallopeptidase [Acetatifactor sp.]|nr:M56 family metallopeptidase [Acetatifactor sp.]
MLEWIISASVLIIMVMAGRKVFKGKVSCWVQYSLWLLVAVRLLVPISPLESVLSVANLLPEQWTGQDAGQIHSRNSIRPVFGTEQGQDVGLRQEEMPEAPTLDMAAPVIPQSADTEPVEKEPDLLLGSHVSGKTAGSQLGSVLGTVWLTGSCLLALWLLGVNGSFRWKVCRDRLPLAVSGNMQRQLPVYVTEEISTPCMYGLLRPTIYITPQAAENPRVLAMVLCHEYMHYRHGDHIWAVVRMLCLCLHWYNPLVWAAVGLSRQDGELACDEGVLRQLGEENRKCYGEALLALSTERRPSLRRSLNLATSMSDTRKQLKERLSALMTMPRMAAGTMVLVFLLVLGLMACTLTGRADAPEESPTADKADILTMSPKEHGETETEVPNSEHMREASSEIRDNMGDAPEFGYSWVLAEEYTGYLDEVEEWEQVYRNQDYDGDGLTDRIYQDVESEPGVMKMRVEFGNGETLSFDTYQNGALMVHSLDLDGDGSRELLFTKPNDFATNPPDIPSDILLFTRQGNGYQRVEVILEDAPEYGATPWEVYLAVSYRKEDERHIRASWRVPGAEGDLGKTQEFLCPVEDYEMEMFEYTSGGREYVAAYDAELIQERYAFLRLYFEGMDRSGDEIWVDMTLEDGRLSPVSSVYVDSKWEEQAGTGIHEMETLEPEKEEPAYDNWNVETLEYYDEKGHPVAEVTEGDITRKLTFVETSWSVSAATAQFSREVLYWACQALLELEQWTGTQVTEICYTVSEFGDFSFGLTPEDMRHSRIFYSRCYNSLSFTHRDVIERIDYSTDMDVWYSPVKQYITPPRYDKMSTEERLIWYFERSAIARGSKVEEVIYPWEGGDYLLRTDQGTYYDFAATEGLDTLGKGLYLTGPYDDIPNH